MGGIRLALALVYVLLRRDPCIRGCEAYAHNYEARPRKEVWRSVIHNGRRVFLPTFYRNAGIMWFRYDTFSFFSSSQIVTDPQMLRRKRVQAVTWTELQAQGEPSEILEPKKKRNKKLARATGDTRSQVPVKIALPELTIACTRCHKEIPLKALGLSKSPTQVCNRIPEVQETNELFFPPVVLVLCYLRKDLTTRY